MALGYLPTILPVTPKTFGSFSKNNDWVEHDETGIPRCNHNHCWWLQFTQDSYRSGLPLQITPVAKLGMCGAGASAAVPAFQEVGYLVVDLGQHILNNLENLPAPILPSDGLLRNCLRRLPADGFKICDSLVDTCKNPSEATRLPEGCTTRSKIIYVEREPYRWRRQASTLATCTES